MEQIQEMLDYCLLNDVFMLRYELKRGKNPNTQHVETLSSLLHVACRAGNTDCVVLLLQFKADPNIINKGGKTPLHEACIAGNSECVRYLLEANADPGYVDKTGNIPLHYACDAGASECIRLLLSHKDIILDHQNFCNETPLHMACHNKRGSAASVRLLLEHGANLNVSDTMGRTPLHNACRIRNTECVRILLNHEAVDLDKSDCDGRTALHEAVRDMEGVSARLLLETGADPHKQDNMGYTPLIVARNRGFHGILDLLEEFTNKEDGKKRERSEDDDDEAEEPSAKRGRPE